MAHTKSVTKTLKRNHQDQVVLYHPGKNQYYSKSMGWLSNVAKAFLFKNKKTALAHVGNVLKIKEGHGINKYTYSNTDESMYNPGELEILTVNTFKIIQTTEIYLFKNEADNEELKKMMFLMKL